MSVTTVILDYGCVLSLRPGLEDFEPLRQALGAPDSASFQEMYWRHRDDYDLDKLDVTTYWQMMGGEVGARLTPEEIQSLATLDCQIWGRPNAVMVEWLRLLRARGLKTAMISNLSSFVSGYLRRNAGWVGLFDQLCFSGEMGVMKPHPPIFHACLEAVKTSAPEALFIDDREVHVAGARAVGINGVMFRSTEQLQSDLYPYGLAELLAEAQARAG